MSAGGGKSAKVLKVLYIHGFEESVDVKTMSRKPKSLSDSVRASSFPALAARCCSTPLATGGPGRAGAGAAGVDVAVELADLADVHDALLPRRHLLRVRPPAALTARHSAELTGVALCAGS